MESRSSPASRLCGPILRTRLTEVAREGAEELAADSAGFAILDGRAIRYVAGYGFDWATVPAIPIGDSLIGAVVAGGCVIDSADIREDPRCTTLGEARRMGIAAFLGGPLKNVDHSVFGALAWHRRQTSRWSAEQVLVAEAVARTASIFLRAELTRTDPDRTRMTVRTPNVVICESPSTKDVYDRAVRIASSALTVLIQGETGLARTSWLTASMS